MVIARCDIVVNRDNYLVLRTDVEIAGNISGLCWDAELQASWATGENVEMYIISPYFSMTPHAIRAPELPAGSVL
jgi:hypothetical protein